MYALSFNSDYQKIGASLHALELFKKRGSEGCRRLDIHLAQACTQQQLVTCSGYTIVA